MASLPSTAVDALLGDAAGALVVRRQGGIVTLQLHRPDRHNAISYAMWSALSRILPALADDDSVDVLVLRGSPGGPFSSGADISEFSSLRAGAEGARNYSATVAAGEAALIAFPRPTIAMIEGFAIGGGTQLAVACDLRVADETSRFGVTPARLGIVYAPSSTARLVETVGAAWARWLLLTAELLDATQALRIGLVHEVHPSGEVEQRVQALADTIAGRARISLTGAKQLLTAQDRPATDQQFEELQARSWSSPEYAEGVEAFLAKRPPAFRVARDGQDGSPRTGALT